MKYVALDIETTGLDRVIDQVLQIALVIEDTENPSRPIEELPTWECLIRWPRISGDAYALHMNREIIEALRGDAKVVPLRERHIKVLPTHKEAIWHALGFIGERMEKKFVVAGKNAAGFDLPFLGEHFTQSAHHRVIDVGSVALGACPDLWFEKYPPSLGRLTGRDVAHDALEDARDVVRVIRKLMKGQK